MKKMGPSRRPRVTSHSIPSSTGGAIDAHIFEPDVDEGHQDRPVVILGSIILVHPWSALGGGEHNTIGLAMRIVAYDCEGGRVRRSGDERKRKWRAVTFALESDPAWKGGPLWGILSNHAHEVGHIIDVVNWVRGMGGGGDIVLLGTSAGAPMAGTASSRLSSNDGGVGVGSAASAISAYVAVGYTFGNLASLAFGRHFPHVTSMTVPRLFIMGERDEFTSVGQLESAARRMRKEGEGCENDGSGIVVDVRIVPDVGHFELESPSHDGFVARTVLDWLDKIFA